MMDDELMELLDREEDHKLDFKRTDLFEDNDAIAKQLVAFANRRGGKLVFGITDDRELEGREILVDIEVGNISRIARSKCSPPVDIDHHYFPNQMDGVDEGDVLVIRVYPASTPTAVTDGVSRIYYLRTTNESRPIEDPHELNWLYTRNRPSTIDEIYRMWLSFDGGFNLLPIKPTPRAYEQYIPFLRDLSPEDKQYLLAEGSRIERWLTEVTPFVLLSSFGSVVSPTFWISYAEEEYDQETIMSELLDSYDEILLSDLSYDPDDRLKNSDPPILEDLSTDPLRIIEDSDEGVSSIVVPDDTTVSIHYLNQMISQVRIHKEDSFEILIQSIRILDGIVSGLPPGHPVSELGVERQEVISVPAGLAIECDFEFPDQPDPEFTQHYAFGHGWDEFLKREWDIAQVFDADISHLHRIEQKIDILDNKLDSILDDDGD